MKLTIQGQVPSKKNQWKIVSTRGRPNIAKSAKTREWEISALWQIREQVSTWDRYRPIYDGPVHLKALIYRKTKVRADLSNLIQSVEDILQRARIIGDDFQIESLDGSRRILGVPPGQERAEIEIKGMKI